jgi:16S rRNA (uracil1498-N3)-methyltransferase
MPENRFFSHSPLSLGETLLDEDEAHHLQHVMRLVAGDNIELIDGKGALAQGTIKKCSKRNIVVEVSEVQKEPPPPFSMIIAQAIPRFQRLDVILEKGTELGMTELWLFPGVHSEKGQFTEPQKERIQKILIAAIKQYGRLYLPIVSYCEPLNEWKNVPYPLFYGDLSPNAPLLINAFGKPEKGVIFAIGPERGWSPEELTHLKTLNGKGVSLHSNILRTDTAPLAALSVMSQLHSRE